MTDLLAQLCAELADNVAELEQAQANIAHRDQRLLEAWEWTSTGTSGCETRSLAEQMEADRRAIHEAIGPQFTIDEEPVDRINEALEQMPTALDALRRYLTRQGLPADPVRLDDPDLWALYEALAPG